MAKRDLEFTELILWICARCGTGIKTREMQPRCRICGFREGPS